MQRLLVFAALAAFLPAQADERIDLFDGKTLDGWTQLSGTAKFIVQDGAIVGTSSADGVTSFLATDRFYGDFELTLETKLFEDRLNSGIQIRSHSYPNYRKGRVHGYQVEIMNNGTAGLIYDELRRGWLTRKQQTEATAKAFQRGKWNRIRVVCKGSSIKTWVNDVPVSDLNDSLTANGFIALQVHPPKGKAGWSVGWRNIRIRELGDGGGWSSLFNGKDLAGWKVNENPESVKVQDGAIIVKGKRAHVFYDGPIYNHSFKNFEFRARVMTRPKANSGIYFHTMFQKSGWPNLGYEVQVNNTQRDWRRTGGLYAVQDVREAPAKDDEWFDMWIRVRGQHVTVKVNGKTTADYVQPPNPERPRNFAQRLLSRGTFAFQCHDPGSEVHYKDIAVKVLHEGSPAQKAAKNASTPHPNRVVWQGIDGPGKGKHIVFLAGDHEYRGEEILPALARIMAKRYGFKSTFLVTTDPKTGFIQPGSDHVTGLEALKTADLFVLAVRFQCFPDDQMQHIEDYLDSGRPVLGLRTSTHGFRRLKGKFAKYNEGYKGDEAGWKFGFGERILGEHWVGHFGRNHRQSSNILVEDGAKAHPILRGVSTAHAVSGGYVGHPVEGSITLARGQVLDGMTPDSPPTKNEKQQVQHAVAWVRNYQEGNAKSRVFATTHGASQDLLDDGFRRMLVNAHLWCLGMEDAIRDDNPIGFVGPYNPAKYSFGGYRKQVKPADIAGFDTPIYDASKSTAKPPRKKRPRRNRNRNKSKDKEKKK